MWLSIILSSISFRPINAGMVFTRRFDSMNSVSLSSTAGGKFFLELALMTPGISANLCLPKERRNEWFIVLKISFILPEANQFRLHR